MTTTVTYPLEDRRAFALWAHAVFCFRNCSSACDWVVSRQLSPFDPLYKPLTVWAVIEYAKPFTKSITLGRLPLVITEGHEELHAFVMNLRNKVVAHLDTRELSHDQPNHHLVRVAYTEHGTETIVEEPKVLPQTVMSLRTVASLLAEKASYHAQRHRAEINNAVRRAGTGLGEYLIDVDDPTGGLRKLSEYEKATLFWE